MERKRIKFYLPSKGVIDPNGPNDPLCYYYNPFVGFLYRSRIQQSLSLLTPPYKRILEIGYGSGILLPTLASICDNVFGIDNESDSEKVNFNLKKLGVSALLTREDISSCGYPDESFDLVVAISVFEHIKEPHRAIEEVFRILKPNGNFLVGMPRVDFVMEKLFPLIGFHNIKDHHITDYRKFLRTAGNKFKLEKFSKIPSFLPVFLSLYFNMLFRKI